MRLTTSMLRRRALLAAPIVVLDPPTTNPNGAPSARADDGDTALAVSELQGQLARTQAAILHEAQKLEARYVRYAWTEQLAADLRAIAHDTPPMGRR